MSQLSAISYWLYKDLAQILSTSCEHCEGLCEFGQYCSTCNTSFETNSQICLICDTCEYSDACNNEETFDNCGGRETGTHTNKTGSLPNGTCWFCLDSWQYCTSCEICDTCEYCNNCLGVRS